MMLRFKQEIADHLLYVDILLYSITAISLWEKKLINDTELMNKCIAKSIVENPSDS